MRIKIAEQQNNLEEQKAGCPNVGRSAEPRQNQLGNNRFHLEEQERADENGEGVKDHGDGYRLSSVPGDCPSPSTKERTVSIGTTSPMSRSMSRRFTSCMISQRSPTASRGTITRKLSVASRHVA